MYVKVVDYSLYVIYGPAPSVVKTNPDSQISITCSSKKDISYTPVEVIQSNEREE